MRRPASTPPELPGYTFDRLLGSGGFSDVFLYQQQLPKRRVAVKVLLTEELTDANRAAFVAEANLMAQLSAHPYIVTIFHAEVAPDGRPYFVMEYCSGPSLGDRYKHEVFTAADALRTGIRLASAVATAHSAGILHRDIKPANVLTNDFGWPALTDFGISSAVDDEAVPLHTQTVSASGSDTSGGTSGQSVGMSVPWSPPEMFEDDPNPDVRSDVFSLAATIYTILAGHTPFEVTGRSNGTLDLIGRIERGVITPMTRTDLPPSMIPVLRKGMSSDRNDRYASAVEFARALQRVELELGYTPTTIDVPNLVVDAPRRREEEDAADATRARGATTINAQPQDARISLPPSSTEPSTEPSAEPTKLRGAQRVDAQPLLPSAMPIGPSSGLPVETVVRRRLPSAAEHDAAEEARARAAVAVAPALSEDEVRKRRSGKIMMWVAIVVAVAVLSVVAISVVMTGAASEQLAPSATTKPSKGDSAVVGGDIPNPLLVSAAAQADTVVFTVKNPKPAEGDAFVWKRTDRTAASPLQVAQGDTITVDGYAPGSTVCIQVSVRRAGQLSAAPLETCFPE